jgi:hypothetical protein
MKRLILVIAMLLIALPALGGKHNTKVNCSSISGFDVNDGELVMTHNDDWSKDRIVVTEDGELTINGDKIEVARRERDLLRKLYSESFELELMADEIAEEAEEIASGGIEYAMAQIAGAMHSLGDDDSDFDSDDLEDIEARFEEEIEEIEEHAEKIEDRADKVVDIAEELKDSIPELKELDWFMKD